CARLPPGTEWALTMAAPDGTVLARWAGHDLTPTITWTPLDDAGQPLPSGDYPYTMTAGPDFRPVQDAIRLGSSSSFDTYVLVANPATDTAHVRLDLA